VLVYACGCQAPINLSDACPVHASPVEHMVRSRCCED
jgi:hypothetical protein